MPPPPAQQHQKQQKQQASSEPGGMDPLHSFLRSAEFWGRASVIYGSYKAAQLRALLMRMQGRSPQDIKERMWRQQHTWAGREMYRLCINLRGFYLKAGQFIGARADFIPEEICRQLCVLQDRVRVQGLEGQARRPHCDACTSAPCHGVEVRSGVVWAAGCEGLVKARPCLSCVLSAW